MGVYFLQPAWVHYGYSISLPCCSGAAVGRLGLGLVLDIGVGDGGQPPPKKKKNLAKNFFGQFLWKILAFFGQKSCKIGEFCSFFGQIS